MAEKEGDANSLHTLIFVTERNCLTCLYIAKRRQMFTIVLSGQKYELQHTIGPNLTF